MITRDITGQKIKEGVGYVANFVKSGMANLATTNLRIKTNEKSVHIVLTADVSANFAMASYEGTTYTGAGTAPNGTALTTFNRIVGQDSINASLYFDATVNVLGTKRGTRLFPGGSGPHTTGSTSGGGLETIIPPNSDWLLVFTCQAGDGQTGNLNVVLDWYEDMYKVPTVTPQLKFTDLVVTDTSVVVIPIVPAFDEDVHFYTIETAETAVIIDATSPADFEKGEGVKQLAMGVNTFHIDGYKAGYEPCRYEITITRV